MELERLQREWNAFGEEDPLWAILTEPSRRGGRWDVEEFLATGREEVDEVLAELADHGLSVKRGRALDFGCGVGRLTQALAGHFDSVDGVDVAASMITGAQRLNPNPGRVRFHHNGAPDLRMFDDESFDFVLSLIVLQHMEPGLMVGYMREFLRVLRPGGVAFFNVPESFTRGEELPAQAWRADLTLIDDLPQLSPGTSAKVSAKVRNTSTERWPTSAYVHLADRWKRPDGVIVDGTNGWAAIGKDLAPGEEVELHLHVVPPRDSGDYVLMLDLVQDSIGWFGDRGSSPLEFPVVVPQSKPAPNGTTRTADIEGNDAEPGAAPTMEMYVMSREEVVGALEEAGALVLDVVPKDRCGATIPSLDYIVSRPVVQPYSRRMGRRSGAPDRPGQVRHALEVMADRADLVRFPLSTHRGRLGRITVSAREALRRAMLEVLHRQSEFNRAGTDLIGGLESQVRTLEATVNDQADQLAKADERIRSLERAVGDIDRAAGGER
jgi:SAM-dependent methyltransferase